jgi:hypothetical protein
VRFTLHYTTILPYAILSLQNFKLSYLCLDNVANQLRGHFHQSAYYQPYLLLGVLIIPRTTDPWSSRATLIHAISSMGYSVVGINFISLSLWTSPYVQNSFICLDMGEKTAVYIEFCEFVNLESTFSIIHISCSKTSYLKQRSYWNTYGDFPALLYRTPSSRM